LAAVLRTDFVEGHFAAAGCIFLAPEVPGLFLASELQAGLFQSEPNGVGIAGYPYPVADDLDSDPLDRNNSLYDLPVFLGHLAVVFGFFLCLIATLGSPGGGFGILPIDLLHHFGAAAVIRVVLHGEFLKAFADLFGGFTVMKEVHKGRFKRWRDWVTAFCYGNSVCCAWCTEIAAGDQHFGTSAKPGRGLQTDRHDFCVGFSKRRALREKVVVFALFVFFCAFPKRKKGKKESTQVAAVGGLARQMTRNKLQTLFCP